jgi:hypothetical protein
MSYTTTKEMHVHKPMIRLLMTYRNEDNVPQSHLINMTEGRGNGLILRTLRWAAHNGIEVTFRPA